MKVLVFGGSFNPPHLGHQMIIEQVMSRQMSDGVTFDQLWLLPVGTHDFDKSLIAKEHRLAMLELLRERLIEKNPNLATAILIERYEIDRDEKSLTHHTLNGLSKLHQDKEFSFLIGSDNLEKFHLWDKNFEEMLAKYPFYVYPRQGFDFQPFYKGMVALMGFPQMAISSTAVRLALQEKGNLEGLLDPKIIAYSKEEQLLA